ncbi:hypothetical protein WJX73_010696 [Symbiochloris irregularis]|uniref:Major facilitator superfamily (MFS) profile domain-containing protein n=1 Tax=Symbiochloris irregularis TaxID=706552 RepID=A0AAW1NWG7_9CHLO
MRRTDHTRSDTESAGYVVVPQASADGARSFPVSSEPEPSLGPVITCVAIASLGAFAFGYHLGVVNGPLAAIAESLGFAGNAALQGLVVSSTLAGAAAGSLTGSSLADNLGRRKAFLLDTVPLFLGPLLCATATSLSAMLAGRLIAGVGIGLSSALVPLYISEVAPTNVRGALGSVNQLVICIGILAALVVNVALPATSWRTMFALAIIPAAVLGLGMLVAPESPRWLFSKGRTSEAEAGARKLWGAAGPSQLSPSPSDSEAAKGPAKSAGLGEALKSRSVRLGCVLFVLQQLSGINAIVYFSSSVFAKAGITSGALASAAVGAINVLGTVVAASLMDKAGRKQLLTLSYTGMGLAMLAMSAGLGLQQFASASGAVALVGTLAYVMCFALGAGPVPGLLVPEITPIRLRGIAVSAAMVTHWIFNFGIGQLFLPAVTQFGVPTVYLFFTFICFFTVFFAKSQLVETKGLSLEQIEAAMAT